MNGSISLCQFKKKSFENRGQNRINNFLVEKTGKIEKDTRISVMVLSTWGIISIIDNSQ